MKGKIDIAMVNEIKGALIMLYLYQFGAFILSLFTKLFNWPTSRTVNVGSKFFEAAFNLGKFFRPVLYPFYVIGKFLGGIILGIVCVIVIICTSVVAYIREYIIKKKEVRYGC